jgi:hypothetical protein
MAQKLYNTKIYSYKHDQYSCKWRPVTCQLHSDWLQMTRFLVVVFKHGMGMKWHWITLFGTFVQVTSLYHANPHFGKIYILPSKQHTYILLDIHGWFYSWGLPSLSKFLHGTFLQAKNNSTIVDTYARETKFIQKFIANTNP